MALFPWEQAVVAPGARTFMCKHCGDTQFISNGVVEVCHCPAAERGRLEERERILAFQKARAADIPSFMDVRERRKLRTGRGR